MKQFVLGTIVLIWIGMLIGIMFPSIMYRLGTFLVVNEEAPPVEVVVTSRINQKVVRCYKLGRCKKIFLIAGNGNSQTWKAISRSKKIYRLKKNAIESGIRECDLFFFGVTRKSKSEFIYENMRKNGMRSGIFLTRYYKTRRYRFFLDRYDDSKDIDLYIQPLKDQYISNLDHWWENTAFANYFLSEYIRMVYYYFNRIFLTDLFINSKSNDTKASHY